MTVRHSHRGPPQAETTGRGEGSRWKEWENEMEEAGIFVWKRRIHMVRLVANQREGGVDGWTNGGGGDGVARCDVR